jgi:membrane-associated phospholipid phosphatase
VITRAFPGVRRAVAVLVGALLVAGAPSSVRADDDPPPPAAAPPSEAPPAPPPLFSLKETGQLVLVDAKGILLAPLHWDGEDWLKFGVGSAGVILTGVLLDTPVQEASQRSRTPGRDDFATTIQRFGSEYSWAVLGGYAVFGVAAKDREAMNVAVDGVLASLFASGIATPVLKFAVGRARPNADLGNHYFTPFSTANQSFPSGHTTQAFAVASVIAAHDDHLWVKILAYGIAGTVGLARIEQNAHWTSDVLAGAILGTAIGNAVVVLNERQRRGAPGPKVTFSPLLAPRGGGLLLTASF